MCAVRHLVVVVGVGAARRFPGDPRQARVGELGAVRHILVVLVLPQLGPVVATSGELLVVLVFPQLGPVVTASGGLLVVLVFPQFGPVVTAGGERRVQLSLPLVPSILIQVLSPVGLSTMRSMSRQGRLPAGRFPRALAGLDKVA